MDEVKGVLTPGVPLTDEKMQQAQKLVVRMGYFDRVTVTFELGPKGADVQILVVERQRIEKITFVGNTKISDEDLRSAILTRVGHLVDEDAISKDITRVQGAYQKKGYLCNVPSAEVDKYGVLTFVISELRIEGFDFEGLTRTQRWVVAKQVKIRPGELYNDSLVREQVGNLRNLGLFEDVKIEPRPGKVDPENSIIIVFQVKERRTGQIGAQAGYSSLDSFVLSLGVSETNFRGQAEHISLTGEFFGRSSYQFSFLEPYFRRGDTSVELSVFDTEQRQQFVSGALISTATDQFEERRRGAFVRVAHPMSDRASLSVMFRSEQVSSAFFQGVRTLPGIFQPENGTGVGTSQVLNGTTGGQTGTLPQNPPEGGTPGPGQRYGPITVAAPLHPGGKLNSFTFGLTQDFRDNLADPKRGSYRRVTFETAGPYLGGDEKFQKIVGEFRLFRPMGEKVVLAGRAMGGTSLGDVPLFESFPVGGANTLRGYEEERFRGLKFLLFNFEYRRAITDKLTGVGFFDAGDAWSGNFPTIVPGFQIQAEDQSLKMHIGVGVGIRVVTQLGPLRLDLGFGDEGSKAHFNFGHTF
jgi:outer membrane protein insertion porin family